MLSESSKINENILKCLERQKLGYFLVESVSSISDMFFHDLYYNVTVLSADRLFYSAPSTITSDFFPTNITLTETITNSTLL